MDRDLLPHIAVVAAVARRGGFAAAGAELGMSPSAVSHAVRIVEDRIGQPLFARTTRRVGLTEAGADFVGAVAPALQDIADRIERVRAVKGRASGLLRINAPHLALPLGLIRVVAALAEQHPDVTVEIFADEGLSDIVGDGFDAGIRLGEMIAADMVAVRLTPPFKAIMVASPKYLQRRGTPKTLTDLGSHNCIGYRLVRSQGIYRWEVSDRGRDVAVAVPGSVIVTDALAARDLALEGIGIAYLFAPLVGAALADGRLVQVLPRTAIEEPGLFLYFPRRASMAPKLRAFIDAARNLDR